MTAEEFAKVNIDKVVRWKNTTDRLRIIGYNDEAEGEWVWTEYDNGCIDTDLRPQHWLVDKALVKYRINGFKVKDLTIINDLPDDCLDCGAKGNEPCKDDCPNKE